MPGCTFLPTHPPRASPPPGPPTYTPWPPSWGNGSDSAPCVLATGSRQESPPRSCSPTCFPTCRTRRRHRKETTVTATTATRRATIHNLQALLPRLPPPPPPTRRATSLEHRPGSPPTPPSAPQSAEHPVQLVTPSRRRSPAWRAWALPWASPCPVLQPSQAPAPPTSKPSVTRTPASATPTDCVASASWLGGWSASQPPRPGPRSSLVWVKCTASTWATTWRDSFLPSWWRYVTPASGCTCCLGCSRRRPWCTA